MKVKTVLIITVFLMFAIGVNLFAQQEEMKSTAIGVRGSYWKMANMNNNVKVITNDEYTSVNVGGAGGWLCMLSRMNYNSWLEFGLGAIARVEEIEYEYDNDMNEVDAIIITPLLIGLRYDIFSSSNSGAIKPYFSFGGGPYWITKVHAEERCEEDEVNVKTRLKNGGYLGGGFNFMLSNWFAVNFDVKHHFINFNINHDYSGFECGLGVSVLWGNFKL